MREIFYITTIILLVIILIFVLKNNRELKKERDYWHEVDEENERLRKLRNNS